jgi:lysophospholipase L1-like esterase
VAERCVLFVGDSFTAGTGDPSGLGGWVGRAVAASYAAGMPLVSYNLGVRGETSVTIAERWIAEMRPRALPGGGVVFCVGCNDVVGLEGRVLVEPEQSVATLDRLLTDAAGRGLPAFVVGPPPLGDAGEDDRARALSAAFAPVAASNGAPYVPVLDDLLGRASWPAEAAAGDGTHPAAGGYDDLAELVLAGGLLEWIGGLATV